jgi:hypothetical protein
LDGKFVAEWKQFGRPSDVAIDKNDMIYVADSQSTPSNNPGFKQGIRLGSVKDGKVTAFIPEPSVEKHSDGVGGHFGHANIGLCHDFGVRPHDARTRVQLAKVLAIERRRHDRQRARGQHGATGRQYDWGEHSRLGAGRKTARNLA